MYKVLEQWLNNFFPLRSITITDSDPTFITPEIKFLLRRKNSLIRACKIEQANAVAHQIAKLITRHNTSKLSNFDPSHSTKDLWDEVGRLTKGSKRPFLEVPLYNSTQLNTYYASVSNDPNYSPPSLKQSTPLESSHLVTQFEVFNYLDKLSPTAAGPDLLPFWFLRLCAPFLAEPLTHLINISIWSSYVPCSVEISSNSSCSQDCFSYHPS